jgi:hypothetical protein
MHANHFARGLASQQMVAFKTVMKKHVPGLAVKLLTAFRTMVMKWHIIHGLAKKVFSLSTVAMGWGITMLQVMLLMNEWKYNSY